MLWWYHSAIYKCIKSTCSLYTLNFHNVTVNYISIKLGEESCLGNVIYLDCYYELVSAGWLCEIHKRSIQPVPQEPKPMSCIEASAVERAQKVVWGVGWGMEVMTAAEVARKASLTWFLDVDRDKETTKQVVKANTAGETDEECRYWRGWLRAVCFAGWVQDKSKLHAYSFQKGYIFQRSQKV